jgi:hypothetical protein
MKLKWREHERLLITVLVLLALGRYYRLLVLAAYREGYPAFFPPVHYYLQDFLPAVAPVLLLYFSYLWANMRIVPGFRLPATGSPARPGFFGRVTAFLTQHRRPVVQTIALFILLSVGLNIALHGHLRRFAFIDRGSGKLPELYMAFVLLVFFGIYAFIREAVIDYIERTGDRKDYMALVCNRITGFILRITLLMEVLALLDFIHDWQGMIILYSLVMCVFLIGVANIYWLFPKYGKERLFNVQLMARLLLVTFVSALLFFILFSTQEGSRPIVPFSLLWIFELFIVTPVSWWIYQYRKDQILKMRGMEKELVQSKSSLAFLRAQINPHFLFNVLNTLYGTALQEQADRTAEGIQRLGDMMRFMLHENNLEYIKMSREIEYLDNYIALQKLRTATSAGIVIEDDIRANHCDHMIAPMLLIPFVENAFKHGISLQEKSWITIILRCDDQHIYFETRNSMHARAAGDTGENGSGIGLTNVHERLKWLYPGRYDLDVNGNGREFVVRLSIRP